MVAGIWDITISSTLVEDENTIKKAFRKCCKKWAFQLEQGDETGYVHYQCRIALHKKTTLNHAKELVGLEGNYTPSSTNSISKTSNFNYVLKPQTRIAGPWTDKDDVEEEEIKIPIQYKVELYKWQQSLYDLVMKEIEEKKYRNVHILYDVHGGIGKTTFALNLTCRRKAEYIPPMNDSKDIMRMCYDLSTSKCYIIDLTRAMKKDKLFSMYSAVEQIKNGYIYDDRYTFKRKFIDSPGVIILTNELPDINLLSSDRWKIHLVENNELIDFDIKELHDNGLDDDDE